MRAAIDIGSNSVRLVIGGDRPTSVITQLALGIENSGVLSPLGIDKTIAALKDFADKTRGCDGVYTFATEAVRRAADGKAFCDRVKRETGLTVYVLSGEQEAYLALNGAKKPDGAVTVCDLGGGSMEIISSEDGIKPSYIKSLPIGVVIAKNMFGGDYRKAIDAMPEILAGYGKVPAYPLVITGGSMCTIAAAMLNQKVYDKDAVSTRFTAKDLDGFMPILLSRKLATIRPIAARRADTVPYGGIIIQALINYVGAREYYVSDASNLEAVIGMPQRELHAMLGI